MYVKNKEESGIDLEQAFDETELMEHIENMRSDCKSWKYTRVLKDFGTRKASGSTVDGEGNEIKLFTHQNYVFKSINEIVQEEKISETKAYFKYFKYVFRDTNAQSSIRGRVMGSIGQ